MITRRKWIGPETYVEVRYQPNWSDDGLGLVEAYYFTRDPRKRQYHKPKYWSRYHIHALDDADWCSRGFYCRFTKIEAVMIQLCRELGLGRTSSDRRAAAS